MIRIDLAISSLILYHSGFVRRIWQIKLRFIKSDLSLKWFFKLDSNRKSPKNWSKPIKIDQNNSEVIKNDQNGSVSIKIETILNKVDSASFSFK